MFDYLMILFPLQFVHFAKLHERKMHDDDLCGKENIRKEEGSQIYKSQNKYFGGTKQES